MLGGPEARPCSWRAQRAAAQPRRWPHSHSAVRCPYRDFPYVNETGVRQNDGTALVDPCRELRVALGLEALYRPPVRASTLRRPLPLPGGLCRLPDSHPNTFFRRLCLSWSSVFRSGFVGLEQAASLTQRPCHPPYDLHHNDMDLSGPHKPGPTVAAGAHAASCSSATVRAASSVVAQSGHRMPMLSARSCASAAAGADAEPAAPARKLETQGSRPAGLP